MAKTNTEKPAGKNEMKKTAPKVPKTKGNPDLKKMIPPKAAEKEEKPEVPEKTEEEVPQTPVQKEEVKKEEPKKEKIKQKKVKKTQTSVTREDTSLSPKACSSICKFIVGKTPDQAIKELEEVTKLRRAVPIKGEYAHRKGKMMSGKYPVKAAKEFIIMLKSLNANAINHDLDVPMISEAYANKGTKVYASGGRIKKRAHIKIIAKERKLVAKEKKK